MRPSSSSSSLPFCGCRASGLAPLPKSRPILLLVLLLLPVLDLMVSIDGACYSTSPSLKPWLLTWMLMQSLLVVLIPSESAIAFERLMTRGSASDFYASSCAAGRAHLFFGEKTGLPLTTRLAGCSTLGDSLRTFRVPPIGIVECEGESSVLLAAPAACKGVNSTPLFDGGAPGTFFCLDCLSWLAIARMGLPPIRTVWFLLLPALSCGKNLEESIS